MKYLIFLLLILNNILQAIVWFDPLHTPYEQIRASSRCLIDSLNIYLFDETPPGNIVVNKNLLTTCLRNPKKTKIAIKNLIRKIKLKSTTIDFKEKDELLESLYKNIGLLNIYITKKQQSK